MVNYNFFISKKIETFMFIKIIIFLFQKKIETFILYIFKNESS